METRSFDRTWSCRMFLAQRTSSSARAAHTTNAPRSLHVPLCRGWATACSQCRLPVVVHAKGRLADDLLDYVTAGPKMRKWYGQGERPSEGGPGPEKPEGGKQEDEEDEEGEGDAILVTDADTPMGEQVVLQLILARASIKALVRDTVAAKTSYGPYVAPLSLEMGNPQLLRRALKGCGSVVCLGRPGALPQVAKEAGVAHVVLLSAAGAAPQGGPLSGLFDGELAALRDLAREAAFAKAGVRCTVVRVAAVRDAPGGCSSLALQAPQPAGSGQAAGPSVSREDVAAVLVQALKRLPAEQSRIFEVRSLGAGAPPSDWSALFDSVASAPA
ncbi:hypothetical protein V8C86DRAFT_3146608 [Haematococcus lacustris]